LAGLRNKEKEKGFSWASWARFEEEKENGPEPVPSLEKYFSISNLLENEYSFECKSNLNFKRLLLIKQNTEALHHTTKYATA
jgi:hypothetical protein